MPKRLLRASQYLWLSLRTWTRRLVFWSRAIGVGAAAVLFAIGSEFTNRIYQRAVSVSPFLPLLIAYGSSRLICRNSLYLTLPESFLAHSTGTVEISPAADPPDGQTPAGRPDPRLPERG